jgi:predicted branched-subunit amino acid permease
VLGLADALTLAAAIAAAVLLYAGSSQLIRNAARLAGRRALRG